MADQKEQPSREKITTWLKSLEGNAQTYGNYMMGLKALNPKFSELETTLEGTGGLKEQIEKSMRNPEMLDLFLKASEDNETFNNITKLTNSKQGQKLLTLGLGAINGDIVSGGSTTTSTSTQYGLLESLGMVEKAKAAGFDLNENLVKTPGDGLMLLSTLLLPVGPTAPAKAAFAATAAGKTATTAAIKQAAPSALTAGARTADKVVKKTAKTAIETTAKTAIPTAAKTTANVTAKTSVPVTGKAATDVAAKTSASIAEKTAKTAMKKAAGPVGKGIKKTTITALKNPIKSGAALATGDIMLNEGDGTKYVAEKGFNWAAEAILGKENHESLKKLYNEGLPDMPNMPDVPDMLKNNSEMLLATLGIAATAYLAYNIGSSLLSTAFQIGKLALGVAAAGYVGNIAYKSFMSPTSPSA